MIKKERYKISIFNLQIIIQILLLSKKRELHSIIIILIVKFQKNQKKLYIKNIIQNMINQKVILMKQLYLIQIYLDKLY